MYNSRGVKAHRGARTSRCKDPTLEQRLRDGLNTDPDNVQLKRRLVTLLQVEVPKGRRIKEAYDICQRMVRNPKKVWKTSSEWQTCVLELCQDYQVQRTDHSNRVYRLLISAGPDQEV